MPVQSINASLCAAKDKNSLTSAAIMTGTSICGNVSISFNKKLKIAAGKSKAKADALLLANSLNTYSKILNRKKNPITAKERTSL